MGQSRYWYPFVNRDAELTSDSGLEPGGGAFSLRARSAGGDWGYCEAELSLLAGLRGGLDCFQRACAIDPTSLGSSEGQQRLMPCCTPQGREPASGSNGRSG